MFGRRPDGRRLDDIDPIVTVMPYIMPTRNDACNLVTEYVDYEPIADYIRRRSKAGGKVSFMGLLIAAYVRVVSQYPEMNRFISNRQVFARNQILVSLTVLRNAKNKENLDEALIKMNFKPDATIDEVTEQIERETKEATDADADNGTVDFATKLVKFRLLVIWVVALARFLDRYGLMPSFIYKVSPFHCSMFITNMASIGMPSLYHHLYNFGNTSAFLALGKFEKQVILTREGPKTKTVIPIGVTTDERICGGASYARAFAYFKNLLLDPSQLEKRPDKIVTETTYKN